MERRTFLIPKGLKCTDLLLYGQNKNNILYVPKKKGQEMTLIRKKDR